MIRGSDCLGLRRSCRLALATWSQPSNPPGMRRATSPVSENLFGAILGAAHPPLQLLGMGTAVLAGEIGGNDQRLADEARDPREGPRDDEAVPRIGAPGGRGSEAGGLDRAAALRSQQDHAVVHAAAENTLDCLQAL